MFEWEGGSVFFALKYLQHRAWAENAEFNTALNHKLHESSPDTLLEASSISDTDNTRQ